MGREDLQPGHINPEFKFTSSAAMEAKSLEITSLLAQHVGEEVAKETGKYLLDAANTMDDALRILLSEKSITDDFYYDGRYFRSKKEMAATFAPCGFNMLTIAVDLISKPYSFKEPFGTSLEISQQNLKSALEYLSTVHITSTVRLPRRFAKSGTVKADIDDFKPISFIDNVYISEGSETDTFSADTKEQQDINQYIEELEKILKEESGE